ncbi:hypothetical protein B0T19DRAFT_419321 [Cercophora scortea]|uniref:Secreted protein n=1 Tax=Cercophora scortea TaxID=314031 RepID=A0AAE0IYZ3_9PEZI|nr:hypothetical protein B0T19DRAFT_419321 [Cercophora scortea]
MSVVLCCLFFLFSSRNFFLSPQQVGVIAHGLLAWGDSGGAFKDSRLTVPAACRVSVERHVHPERGWKTRKWKGGEAGGAWLPTCDHSRASSEMQSWKACLMWNDARYLSLPGNLFAHLMLCFKGGLAWPLIGARLHVSFWVRLGRKWAPATAATLVPERAKTGEKKRLQAPTQRGTP